MARATGASLKVSASQPCKGKTGTLTAKAKRNASATQQSGAVGRNPEATRICRSEKLNVPVREYSHRIATSNGAEGINVKRKNLIAAFGPSLRPYIAIRIARGTSDSSQNP